MSSPGVWLSAWLLLLAACSDGPAHEPLPPQGVGGAGSMQSGGSGGAGGSAGSAGSGSGGAMSTGGRASLPDPERDAAVTEVDASADAASDADAMPEPFPDPVPEGCITSAEAQAGVHTVPCESLSFVLSVPERCLGASCGLIIDVHGGTMSAAMEDKNTELRALGGDPDRPYGYVVIQPNADLGLFDAATDDARVLAFAERAIRVFHLDEDRVHMTGFSQGGYMTWRFICERTSWLASAAPAAAAGEANISAEVGCTFTGDDRPSGKLDVLYMHGTQDALVDYDNAERLRDALLEHYGPVASEVLSEDEHHFRIRYVSAEGYVFEYLSHDYASPSAVGVPPLGVAIAGHCYPGSRDQEITEEGQLMAFGCAPPNAFTWGEAVIDFFDDHPRR